MMKPLVFNKDSWHYALATRPGSFSRSKTDSNICEYTRAVLMGLVLATFMLAVAAATVYWILITLVWWVVIIQHGFFEEAGPLALSIMVALVILVAGITRGIPWLYRYGRDVVFERLYSRYYDGDSEQKVRTDSFVTKAYRSWKEKTCVRVTLIEDDH